MTSWPAPFVPPCPGRRSRCASTTPPSGELRPTSPGPTATLYVCGITPYDATHLGHAATYVTFDLVQRVWRDNGHAVHYVQNVTDVDDPLLERAERDGVDWRDLAQQEIALFHEDMTALAVLPPDDYVSVVDSVGEIAADVRALVEAGAAYGVDVPGRRGRRRRAAGRVLRRRQPAALRRGVELDPRADARGVRRARRRPGPGRQEGRAGRAAVAGGPPGRTVLGRRQPGPRPARLARRVLHHRAASAGHVLRPAGRRHRPGLPAPRDERRARRVADRRVAVRAQLRAPGDGRPGRAQDEQVPRQPGAGVARCAGPGWTRWRSGWRCWTTTTAPTGSTPTRSWRRRSSGWTGGARRCPATAARTRARPCSTSASASATTCARPDALAAVDRWADQQLNRGGDEIGAPGVLARALDALLGVRL